jgi:hypothetical protein
MKYKIMENSERFGQEHTTNLTFEEAHELLNRLQDYFPDIDYWIEQYREENKKPQHYNNNAIDGWEDLYPL